MSGHTISERYLTLLLATAERNGLSMTDLITRHRLMPSRGFSVPTVQVSTLMEEISTRLDDEFWGLGESNLPKGSAHFVMRLMAGCKDLAEALELAGQFCQFLNKRPLFSLTVEDGIATYQSHVSAGPHDPLLSSLLLLFFHRISGWLIGEQVVLQSVDFDQGAPAVEDDFQYLFPCPRHYNSTRLAIRFNAHYLKLQIDKDDEEIKRFLANYPLDILVNQIADDSYSGQIRRQLQSCTQCQFPGFEKVAANLGMSTKRLRLRLKDEGTSYQAIKDLLRKDKAVQLINQRKHSIGDIASMVGFTEAGAFIRAFKGWTGSTPGNYQNP